MKRTFGMTVKEEEKEIEYCNCEKLTGVFSELDMWGYWDCCDKCNKKVRDGFHYYSEEEVY